MGNEKIYAMSFAKIYPLLVNKAVKKGRTMDEVNEVIQWLTGYDAEGIKEALEAAVSYEAFFHHAPKLNPNRKRITGVVCGVRVENIEEPLMQEIRYLDKLIDELAKGKSMEQVLRKNALMWTCPKCGRQFKRTNQEHFCGKAPATVEEYIELQAAETHPYLNEMRKMIRESVPTVKERIAWSMPTYDTKGGSISFAACKKHISFYVGAEAIEKFKAKLEGFATKKNAIYLPYNQELPLELLGDIAKWCLDS